MGSRRGLGCLSIWGQLCGGEVDCVAAQLADAPCSAAQPPPPPCPAGRPGPQLAPSCRPHRRLTCATEDGDLVLHTLTAQSSEPDTSREGSASQKSTDQMRLEWASYS